MFGLSLSDYQFIVKHLESLQQQGAQIWCFGSRARGDHHAFSDLDLMVVSSTDLMREISALKEIFEESRLPIKIDLVQESDFAKSYYEKYLRERKIFGDL